MYFLKFLVQLLFEGGGMYAMFGVGKTRRSDPKHANEV